MAPLNVGVALLVPDMATRMAPTMSPPVTNKVVPNPFNEASYWFLDTGASVHMTPAHSTLDQSTTYTGKDCVIVGNGAFLPITHTSKISPSPDLYLLDILVVPHLTKNLLLLIN